MSDPKNLAFQVVPDSERGDNRGAHRSEAFVALLEGKTLAVVGRPGSLGNFSRQAKVHGKRLRTHGRPDGSTVIWFEDVEPATRRLQPVIPRELTDSEQPDEELA